jgi:hypothetical protein
MLLLYCVVLSVIIGYIRKGRLRHLENLNISYWYLITVAFFIQTIALRMTQINDTIFYMSHMLSYVIIMYVCIINWNKLSIILIGLGNLLNMIVIGFNQGKMPVKVPAYITEPFFDRGHMLMTEATKFRILGDLILIRVPLLHGVISIGDVLLVIGVFLIIQAGMLRQN